MARTDVSKLNYAKRQFTDEDLNQLPLRKPSYSFEEVDFSQNRLSSYGLRAVLDLCLRCQKLRILRLFKNQIDDGGAEGLAKLCEQCPSIEEIHLSHNRFTGDGVERIISAAERARPAHAQPLWLRMEQNEVLDPEDLLRDFQRSYSVCGRSDKTRCTNRACRYNCKIHLPFFFLQKKLYGLQEERPRRVVLTARSDVDVQEGSRPEFTPSRGEPRHGDDSGDKVRRHSPSRRARRDGHCQVRLHDRPRDRAYDRAEGWASERPLRRLPAVGRRRLQSRDRGEGQPPSREEIKRRHRAPEASEGRYRQPLRRRCRSPLPCADDRSPMKRRQLGTQQRPRFGGQAHPRFEGRQREPAPALTSSRSSSRSSGSSCAPAAPPAAAAAPAAAEAAPAPGAAATAPQGAVAAHGSNGAAGQVLRKALSPGLSSDDEDSVSCSSSHSARARHGKSPVAATSGTSGLPLSNAVLAKASDSAPVSPRPSPRSVNRSPPSSEPSRSRGAQALAGSGTCVGIEALRRDSPSMSSERRWKEDRGCSPPSRSRSRSPRESQGAAAAPPASAMAAGIVVCQPKDGSAADAPAGQSAPTDPPRDVQERMETLKERLTQTWQVNQAALARDKP